MVAVAVGVGVEVVVGVVVAVGVVVVVAVAVGVGSGVEVEVGVGVVVEVGVGSGVGVVKTSQLFRRKLKVRVPESNPEDLRALYLNTFMPYSSSATQFFRSFTVNGQERCWLLPEIETYEDLAMHRIECVMKYKDWFLKQVKNTRWRDDDQIPGAEVISK